MFLVHFQLTSMSPEALSSSIGEIGEVICMSDAIPMLVSMDEPPQMEQEQTQPSLIPESFEVLSDEILVSEMIEELLQMEQQPSIFSEGGALTTKECN